MAVFMWSPLFHAVAHGLCRRARGKSRRAVIACTPGTLLRQGGAFFAGRAALQREDRLVARVPGRRREHRPLPFRRAVVLKLERFAAHQDLRRPHERAQRPLVLLQHLGVSRVRRVARHDQQHRHRPLVAARRFFVVGQVLENHPLIQRTERGRELAQVNRRADDQAVGFADRVQHLRQAVLADAVALVRLRLAAEARNAPRVLFAVEEVKALHHRAGALRAPDRLRNQRVRVPALPRAGVHRNNFLSHKISFRITRAVAARRR